NEGKKLKNDEIGDYSRAAAKEWHENPQIHWYFEILENLAKRVHNQEYKDFKFSPQKRGKNKSNTVNNKQTKKFSESMCFDFQGIFNHNDVPEEVVVNQETTEFSEFFDFDYYYSQLQCFP
ncbi:19532_t:CDS:1, partial [Racocetra fulgida]